MMLTKRQKQIFDYVKDSIERNGFAPSLVEICQYLKLHSISTVHKHLLHLEEKGLIRRQWNRARAIEIVPVRSKLEARELPLIGLISEGVGIEAVRVNEMVSIPANMIGHRDVFVLRMKGDSMAEDQVCDGDYLIVENRTDACDGEIVLALLGGCGTTVRKFCREDDVIRLEPLQSPRETLIVGEDEVEIQGVIVGLMRQYCG